jgi:pimeloyl-ACP methyl ester carboxylesterase
MRTDEDRNLDDAARSTAPFAWARRDVDVEDGIRFAVFEAGPVDAKPLVLLHGIGHWTQAAWDVIAPALARDYRLIAFDLPGFGESSKPDARYDLAYFTRAVAALFDRLELDHFALLGNSLGGLISASYAGDHPRRVALLGLLAPAGFLRTPGLVVRMFALAPLMESLRLRTPRWLVRRTIRLATFDAAVVPNDIHERAYALAQDRHVRRAFGRVYAGARREVLNMRGLHARFARYAGPALLIWGRHDNYLPVVGLARARRVYPQARVALFERCGHLPQVEKPHAVAELLLEAYPP